ncbi:hypothetical protein J1614_001769 [Plenodomus biglobosus]|nr:hypothetical protein J1614_001769 [Plenodomus biglobosus]
MKNENLLRILPAISMKYMAYDMEWKVGMAPCGPSEVPSVRSTTAGGAEKTDRGRHYHGTTEWCFVREQQSGVLKS